MSNLTPVTEFEADDIGRVFTWAEVSEVHRSRNGIYQKEGKLISLLTDLGKINPCYPDFESDESDSLFYTGAGRRGDQKLDVFNSALRAAIGSTEPVPLFCKLDVNRWRFMGYWSVTDSEYVRDEKRNRMIWQFVLKRTDERS